ncbi:putative transposase like protein [Trichonephila clavipes]|uniref:Putative transposase like protein n=1 Tax=Trichonephila clavipes TaxID=2585209 RepID=A0A8X6RQI8_TRICX|nr:putative transposase like protein [Trichonephila clavipes]
MSENFEQKPWNLGVWFVRYQAVAAVLWIMFSEDTLGPILLTGVIKMCTSGDRWSSMTYSSVSIKAFLAEQNIPLLDWPGNSPDMNPIENIWELMKREVAKDVITNKTQLLERIIHVHNHHPQMQETVQSSIDSMPCRIEALIAAKGGSTKY